MRPVCGQLQPSGDRLFHRSQEIRAKKLDSPELQDFCHQMVSDQLMTSIFTSDQIKSTTDQISPAESLSLSSLNCTPAHTLCRSGEHSSSAIFPDFKLNNGPDKDSRHERSYYNLLHKAGMFFAIIWSRRWPCLKIICVLLLST